MRAALEALISGGVGEVKVQQLGQQIGVSRSSFYWYFKDRDDLLEALLELWETRNTGVIADYASHPSTTVTEAVATLFLAFVRPDRFDPRLDFAIREWARRSPVVRARVDASDGTRLAAIAAMFCRHGYASEEAETRARILYYQQIGYYALDLDEPMEDRIGRVAGYLLGFTGQSPRADELARFETALRDTLAEDLDQPTS